MLTILNHSEGIFINNNNNNVTIEIILLKEPLIFILSGENVIFFMFFLLSFLNYLELQVIYNSIRVGQKDR